MTTDITLPMPTDIGKEYSSLAEIFTKGDVETILSRIESDARSQAPDLTTATGRKAVASLAYKVAQSKTALDAAGKSLTDEARASINAVDAERRKIRDRLDDLKSEIRSPLDAWEAEVKARQEYIEAMLDHVRMCGDGFIDGELQPYGILFRELQEKIEYNEENFGDKVPEAIALRDAAIAKLTERREVQRERKAMEAEVERLRAEADARRIADEAAAAEAEARRQAEDEAKRKVEIAAKIEADKLAAAEAAKIEAEERAAREAKQAEERHAREIAEAKAKAERAAQDERDRIEADRAAAEAARVRREADQSHRASIKADITAALAAMSGKATPDAIADALMDGKIPHVNVTI